MSNSRAAADAARPIDPLITGQPSSRRRQQSVTQDEPEEVDFITKQMLQLNREAPMFRRPTHPHIPSQIFSQPAEAQHRRAIGPQPRPIDDAALLPLIAPPRVEDMRKDAAIASLAQAPTMVERMIRCHVEQDDMALAMSGGGAGVQLRTSQEQSVWSGRRVLVQQQGADSTASIGMHSSPDKPTRLRKRPENYDAYAQPEMHLKETFKVDGKLSSNRLLFNPITGEATPMTRRPLDAAPSPPRPTERPPLHIWSHRFTADLPPPPAEGTLLFKNIFTGESTQVQGGGKLGQAPTVEAPPRSEKVRTYSSHDAPPASSNYAPYGRFDQPPLSARRE